MPAEHDCDCPERPRCVPHGQDWRGNLARCDLHDHVALDPDPLQPIRDVLAAARAWRDHDWVDQREALDAAIDALPDDTDALLAEARRGEPPPDGRVLLLATKDVLDMFGTRTADGRLMTMDLGEPDEHGWYTPTFTAHDDGFPQAARDGLALAALLAVWEGTPRTLTIWRDEEATYPLALRMERKRPGTRQRYDRAVVTGDTIAAAADAAHEALRLHDEATR